MAEICDSDEELRVLCFHSIVQHIAYKFGWRMPLRQELRYWFHSLDGIWLAEFLPHRLQAIGHLNSHWQLRLYLHYVGVSTCATKRITRLLWLQPDQASISIALTVKVLIPRGSQCPFTLERDRKY